MPRITDFCSCIYVLGRRLSLVRLCDSDFGITAVDDITFGITCAAFCFHVEHISFASSWCLFCLSVIVFGEVMCIWDCYVYQKSVLCFLIHKSYVRSIKRVCFVCKYAAIPVQLKIFILQYIGWCVLIMWTSIVNQFSCFYYCFKCARSKFYPSFFFQERFIVGISINVNCFFL